ncbi:MAG: helix-turn-helix transcriptional regulator [Deltaproteobacteria bacterium]
MVQNGLPARLGAWLQRIDLGMLLCDARGALLWRNASAAKLCPWRRIPREVLREARRTGSVRALGDIRFRFFAVASPNRPTPGYLVVIQREVLRASSAKAALGRLGATERQIQLYLAKRKGGKLSAVAAELGIRYKTADFHLQALFRRLGVHGFVELEAKVREQLGAEGDKPRPG